MKPKTLVFFFFFFMKNFNVLLLLRKKKSYVKFFCFFFKIIVALSLSMRNQSKIIITLSLQFYVIFAESRYPTLPFFFPWIININERPFLRCRYHYLIFFFFWKLSLPLHYQSEIIVTVKLPFFLG